MIASIPGLQSALCYFMNGISIRQGCSQISEIIDPSTGYLIYLYVVILSFILISRQVYRSAGICCILSYTLPFKKISAWPTAATAE
jgi:hypothetical protein